MHKKGFTLVELMVVVAIVAILAAVALPMYSSFKQKSRVSTVIKSCTGVSATLQAWYSNTANFSGIAVDTTGGALTHGTKRLGSGLPTIPNVEWSVTNPSTSVIRINWVFTATCPTGVCNGYWELTCYAENDLCDVAIRLDAINSLGMNTP